MARPKAPPGPGVPRVARPTIKDVARAAQVSPATVSNVLLGRSSVADELAERVRRVVDELGYRPDVAASNLRRLQASVIGLLVPDLSNPFFATLTARVEALARRAGYRLVVATTAENAEDEEAELSTLLGWRLAGVVVVPTDPQFRARHLLERARLPTVVVDRIPAGIGYDRIGVDNVAAAEAAVARLLELGHRRLLAVATDPSIPNIAERISGAERAARAGGAALEVVVAGTELPEASAALDARFASGALPTAVFALTSIGALATLRAARRYGLEIPADLSLVSFDDHDWMDVLEPRLSAVSQPLEAVAEAAFERLLARIGGATAEPCDLRLGCRFEWRGSTAPPRPEGRPAPQRDNLRLVEET